MLCEENRIHDIFNRAIVRSTGKRITRTQSWSEQWTNSLPNLSNKIIYNQVIVRNIGKPTTTTQQWPEQWANSLQNLSNNYFLTGSLFGSLLVSLKKTRFFSTKLTWNICAFPKRSLLTRGPSMLTTFFFLEQHWRGAMATMTMHQTQPLSS